jgi:hypothetical protein
MKTTIRSGLVALATTWVLGTVAVAADNGFVTAGSVPWPTVVAVGVPVGAVVILMISGHLKTWTAGVDPRWPAAVQLWRVVGAAFLFGWQSGELPSGFAIPAGVGDIATGLAALWFLAAVHRDSLTRRHLVSFTLLGIGDFAVAVVTGVALSPANLEALPWILFPTLAVPFFAIFHAVSWVQLSGASTPGEVSSGVVGSTSISSSVVVEVDRDAAVPVATA